MSISYPITLPSSPGFQASAFRMRSVVAVSASPFTGEQQAYQHQGQWWEAELTLPPMKRAAAEPWLAALGSLMGRRGTFLLGDPDGAAPLGTFSGTPLVNGAAQSGNSLVTDGWTPSITLKAGNYIQLGSGATARLHKLLKDAAVDGAGNATLDLFPRLRESPADNAAIVTSSCLGQFRLVAEPGWNADEAGVYRIAFSAVEAI
jgi:hypothetical protein